MAVIYAESDEIAELSTPRRVTFATSDEVAELERQPASIPREALRGVNRGIAQFGDILTSPVRVGLQAAGVPLSGAPIEGAFERAGFTAPPQSQAGAVVQRVAEPVGGSIIPGGGLTAAGARLGTRAVSPTLRFAGARPGAFTAGEAAASLGAGIGAEIGREVGGTPGALVGSVAGAMTPAATGGAIRRTLRGSPNRMMQAEVIDPASGQVQKVPQPDAIPNRLMAFERQQVPVSAGQAGGTHAGRLVEATAGGIPGGNVVARNFAERQADALQNAVTRVVRTISGGGVPSATEAGRTIKRGAADFVDRMKARTDALYARLDEQIPPDTPVAVQNTQDAIERMVTPTAGMEATTGALVPARLKRLADTLAEDVAESGTVPYAGLKALRSEIGERIGSPSLAGDDIRTGQLRRLYGALSEDMRAAAAAAGPEASRLFNRANSLFSRGAQYVEKELAPAVKKLDAEGIFTALERGNRDGATKLNRLRTALTPAQWREVSAAVVNRLGRATRSRQDATGQAFSPETFLSVYSDLSAEARRSLFPNRSHRRAVNDLATIADAIRQGAESLRNPSGTANRTINVMTGMGLIGAAGTGYGSAAIPLLKAMAGSTAGMYAMTSPRFVRWLARGTRLPVAQIPGHVTRLADMAERDPGLARLANDYLSSLIAPEPDQSPAQTAAPQP